MGVLWGRVPLLVGVVHTCRGTRRTMLEVLGSRVFILFGYCWVLWVLSTRAELYQSSVFCQTPPPTPRVTWHVLQRHMVFYCVFHCVLFGYCLGIVWVLFGYCLGAGVHYSSSSPLWWVSFPTVVGFRYTCGSSIPLYGPMIIGDVGFHMCTG
jgi:hypothetical protein